MIATMTTSFVRSAKLEDTNWEHAITKKITTVFSVVLPVTSTIALLYSILLIEKIGRSFLKKPFV